MVRHTIALCPPTPLPPLPTTPAPSPSPLQSFITQTLASSDYDALCVPLTNSRWQDRWERLCLRPIEDDDTSTSGNGSSADRTGTGAREATDREADEWRRDGGLRREECNITRLEESPGVIALASDWLELDSPDEGIRFDSELALRSEIAQALYLSIQTIIIPAPILANRAYLPSYARAIANALQQGGPGAFTHISIRIPISDPLELIGQGPAPSTVPGPGDLSPATPTPTTTNSGSGSTGLGISGFDAGANKHKRAPSLSTRPTSMHQAQLSQLFAQGGQQTPGQPSGNPGVQPSGLRLASGASAVSSAPSVRPTPATFHGDPCSTWEMWDCIRTICGYHPRLSVTLDLTNPLPPSVGALARWTSEPVKNIWLPAGSFIPNAKGYPVLSKACQAFLRGMTRQNPTFILADTHLQRHPAGGPNAYLQYVRHITSQPPAPGIISPSGPNELTQGYGDYLQAPLQPLMDDLSSATYDVFERDPVKYRQYEEAVYLALMDIAHPQPVITVVGAGRGPIVACVLSAMQRANRLQARVYAVEKNAAAFVSLQDRKEIEWGDAVTILFGDMRTMQVPEPADLIVSELLGSFGDNELSPECLDGATRFLKPQGISIPMSYTAHLAPISSSKLHHDATGAARGPGGAETPYVVMMQQVNLLSGEGGGVAGRCGEKVQQCWQFEHPRRDLILDSTGSPLTNSHNTRSATLTFHIPHASPCHGLAGYFEAHLYANVGLSIHPDNAHRVSPNMFSWFPLFFPFKSPLYLPSGAELDVSIWRLFDGRGKKIWYEWCAEAYLPTSSYPPQSAPGSTGLMNLQSAALSRGPSTASGGSGAPQLSPVMDAPFSPNPLALINGSFASVGSVEIGRVKIGQTVLHNPGGSQSWVGL